jgi:hypothetical protein
MIAANLIKSSDNAMSGRVELSKVIGKLKFLLKISFDFFINC